MAVQIQLKRGTQAEVDGGTLVTAEPALATDTGLVWIYDGANKVMVGGVQSGTYALRPTHGVAGRFYRATDDPYTNIIFEDTGAEWIEITPYVKSVPSMGATTTTLDNLSTTSYKGARWDYVVWNGTATRSGQVMGVWNTTTDEYTNISTLSLGDTSEITLFVDAKAFKATTTATGWSIKFRRYAL